MHCIAEPARVQLADGFVNRHNASDLDRIFESLFHCIFRLVFTSAEDLDLRLHELEASLGRLAPPLLDLAEEREHLSRLEAVFQICTVKPGADNRLHALSYDQLKNRHTTLCAVKMRCAYLSDDAGRFSRTQLGNRFRIRAILVAKRQVVQKIFDGGDPLLVENRGRARAYSLDVLDGRVEFEHRRRRW